MNEPKTQGITQTQEPVVSSELVRPEMMISAGVLKDVTVKTEGTTCMITGKDVDCHLVFSEDVRMFLEGLARQYSGRGGLVLLAVKEAPND